MKKQHTLAIILGKGMLSNLIEKESIEEKLKIASANSLFLAVKFSTLHYLVQGSTFGDVHKITEKYYEHFFEGYDFYNERLVQRHNTPIRTIKEATETTKLNETELKDEYTIEEALKEVLSLLNRHRSFIHNMKKIAAEDEDFVTEDHCIDELSWLDKEIWFIKSRLSINHIS